MADETVYSYESADFAEEKDSMPASRPIRILAINDSQTLRNALTANFAEDGLHVASAPAAPNATDASTLQGFDAAAVDLTLGAECDLHSWLERLSGSRPEMRLLLLSPAGFFETRVDAMNLKSKEHSHPRARGKAGRGAKAQSSANSKRARGADLAEMVGRSSAMQRVLHMIEKMAGTDEPVLIQGESGTGKDVAARLLHAQSLRRKGPLIMFNCAVIHESLLESELFGHEKGAFTTAIASRPGLIELADGGTLFIDEIGEMPLGFQAKLLRVLEDYRVRRVGGTRWSRVDVRVVTATNKDLAREVAERKFREDLYYRLNVLSITIPPLRERREDIPLLVEHFLKQSRQGANRVNRCAIDALIRYDWPGNIRELQNALKRARVLAESTEITLADLPGHIADPGKASPPIHSTATESNAVALEDLERHHVSETLRAAAGNVSRAAKALGITRQRLYRLIDKYGLPH